ncbi:MAG TPA: hypothetical protein VFS21_23970 [Roseiflexaceae bacterium]|nr:hypothetical protein [Roseiflexaceae bacterium]
MGIVLQTRLEPLRIPAGWQVFHNVFTDADPLEEAGEFVNSFLFVEDLLYIRAADKAVKGAATFHLYLGWWPDQEIDGAYDLSILMEGPDDLRWEFSSSQRSVIVAQIERWLRLLDAHQHGRITLDLAHFDQIDPADVVLPAESVAPLEPLRIGTGWVVALNRFHEGASQGSTAVDAEQALLQLTKPGDETRLPLELLLGIAPASEGGRAFLLTLRRGDTTEILRSHQTVERADALATLEEWVKLGYQIQTGEA